jgi:thiol-disulfide isomerase/thioredoxin
MIASKQLTSAGQRRRRLTRALVGLPLLCISAVPLRAAAATTELPVRLPPLNSKLTIVDVPLLDGGTFRVADTQGKVLVLYWWASWCPFCAIQTPLMQALWDKHRDQGLLLLGISTDKRPDDARRYLSQRRYTFPSTFLTPEVRQVLPLPGKGLPVTVVLGRAGRVSMAEAGQLFPEDVERIARFL